MQRSFCVFLAIAFLVGSHRANGAQTNAEALSRLDALLGHVDQKLIPMLRSNLAEPAYPWRSNLKAEILDTIAELRALPGPPTLHSGNSAVRFQRMAALEVGLARVEALLTANDTKAGEPGVDHKTLRKELAQNAMKDLVAASNQWQRVDNAAWQEWFKNQCFETSLYHYFSYAHAIAYETTGKKSEARAARDSWQKFKERPCGDFIHSAPTPELDKALGLVINHGVETMLWVGVGLIVVMLIVAILVPKPTDFQLLVFRVTTALGAAGIGANLPGTLGFQSDLVTASGAAAFFVIVFLINPPRFARKLRKRLKQDNP